MKSVKMYECRACCHDNPCQFRFYTIASDDFPNLSCPVSHNQAMIHPVEPKWRMVVDAKCHVVEGIKEEQSIVVGSNRINSPDGIEVL